MFLNNVNLFSVLVVATWGPGSQITDNFFYQGWGIRDTLFNTHCAPPTKSVECAEHSAEPGKGRFTH